MSRADVGEVVIVGVQRAAVELDPAQAVGATQQGRGVQHGDATVGGGQLVKQPSDKGLALLVLRHGEPFAVHRPVHHGQATEAVRHDDFLQTALP